jgi:multiple sugar transport system substrate-binding protein
MSERRTGDLSSTTGRHSRRDFLRRAAGGALGLAGLSLLAACSGTETAPGGSGATTVAPTAGASSAPAAGSSNAPTTAAATVTRAATTAGATTATGGAGATRATASAGANAGPGSFTSALQVKGNVEIEYWQYQFDAKVELVKQLIPEFQQANPQITVKQVNFPYDDFRQKFAAAIQAGEGPDVINVYYGWLPAYVQQKVLLPLPAESFGASAIEGAFFPMVKTAAFNGQYYALPTAVRTLALFYNKDLLGGANKHVPKTWDEFVDVAKATTKRNGDKLEIEGTTYDPGGQGHQWWRECLNRQNGLVPMSDDHKKLFWSDPKGVEAFSWYMDLIKKHKVCENGFDTDGATAFQKGHAALHVDGSYRISAYTKNAPQLNYGIAPLPPKTSGGPKATYASFWCNAITRKAQGDKAIAAAKFIDFLASPGVMRRWTPAIGELPARQAVASEEQFTKDEKLSAFITQLPDSYATFFVDESADRKAVMDAMDAVLLNDVDPKQAVTEAQEQVQQLLDTYWANVK